MDCMTEIDFNVLMTVIMNSVNHVLKRPKNAHIVVKMHMIVKRKGKPIESVEYTVSVLIATPLQRELCCFLYRITSLFFLHNQNIIIFMHAQNQSHTKNVLILLGFFCIIIPKNIIIYNFYACTKSKSCKECAHTTSRSPVCHYPLLRLQYTSSISADHPCFNWCLTDMSAVKDYSSCSQLALARSQQFLYFNNFDPYLYCKVLCSLYKTQPMQ